MTPLLKIFGFVVVSSLALVVFVVLLLKAKAYFVALRAQRDDNNFNFQMNTHGPPNNNVPLGPPPQTNGGGIVEIFYIFFAFLSLLDLLRTRNAGGDTEPHAPPEQDVPDHLHPAQLEAGLTTNDPSRRWRLLMPGSMLEILNATLGRQVFVVPTSWFGNTQRDPEPLV